MSSQSTLLAIAAIVAGTALALLARRATAAPAVPFVPDPHNDKALVVQGWTTDELRKILGAFTGQYKDSPAFTYTIHQDGTALRVVFPGDIEAHLFLFLVNYAQYPRDFNLEGRAVVSVGIATVTRSFDAPDAAVGKKAVFYVPADDRDFDVVYVSVGGQAYRQSFTNMQWKAVEDARMPAQVGPLNR
jgi:hypothetical protein